MQTDACLRLHKVGPRFRIKSFVTPRINRLAAALRFGWRDFLHKVAPGF